MNNLLTIAFFTGFFGDALLQVIVSRGFGGSEGWGLKEYFKQHGKLESMFIAGALMWLLYYIYITLKLPLQLRYLIIYGVLWDLLWRKLNLFSSLKGYYKHLNYFESAVWGAIPMMIPLLIFFKYYI